MVKHHRAILVATAFVMVGIMIVALFVPPAVAVWLGLAPLVLIIWPVRIDSMSPASIAVGHLGLIASCFAVGLHDNHRAVWLTLLAAAAVLPLAWAFRRSGRATKATAGVVLSLLSFGVFVWSTEQLDGGTLSELADLFLLATVAGIVMIVQALRPVKPPSAPALIVPAPPARPVRPPWSRDVT
jgi:hypothetical protein